MFSATFIATSFSKIFSSNGLAIVSPMMNARSILGTAIHNCFFFEIPYLRIVDTRKRSKLKMANEERERLTARKTAIEDSLYRLQQSYVQEADGTGGSLSRGIDKLTNMKREAYSTFLAQHEPELQDLTSSIQVQDSILYEAKSSLQQKRLRYEVSINENIGFLERNKALSDLAAEENSVFWTSFLISLLIILIEIGPILSKLIMPVGPYDIALAKEELTHMAFTENEMRKDKELVTARKKTFYENQREISDPELVATDGLHPSAKEYLRWAEKLFSQIRQYL